MNVIFDGADAIMFYLGGNPEKIAQVPVSELPGLTLERTSSPQELADRLIDVAFWIYANQVKFPDDDIDCWVDIITKKRLP